MESPIHFIFFIILFACHVKICFNKDQRYNPNSDFLLHEAGALAPNNKNDYNTNFPSLPSSKLSTLSTVGPSVNSVATNKPQASGKRDYVAPQRPSINPTPITPPTLKLNPIPNSGSTSHSPKRDYVAPQFPTLKPVGTLQHQSGSYTSSPNNKNEYNANFPSLPSSKPTTLSTLMPNGNSVATTKLQSSGKRDYVAPQRQSVNPTPMTPPTSKLNQVTNSGGPKRDYVAPQFPTLRPVGTSQHQSSAITTPMTPSSPKRDYVAPKNDRTQNVPGKVKDLINFYDSKSQGGIVPSKQPSYSSILHGSTSSAPNGPNVLPSTIMTPAPPRKPAVTNNNNLSASRQGSTVLPSSIVNNQGQGINSNSPTDEELKTISEELLRKDVNNAAKYITVNYQEKTTSMSMDDKAPLPLLTIAPEVWNIPTVQKFVPLLDNYERDTLVNEHVTSQERNEENAFMDAIMTTSVIRHLMNFLKDKGYVTPDPKQQRDFLKQIWFGLYSRGKGKISSSGFEHIFVSELKNGEVSGLHNWVYFSKEEQANRANYLGYMKSVEFSDKGAVIKMHFNQQGVDKPVSTMFIGTSPELEMAIYTLCYVTRVDNDCNIKLGTKDVNILTHNFRYRSKNYIGSAYPQI